MFMKAKRENVFQPKKNFWKDQILIPTMIISHAEIHKNKNKGSKSLHFWPDTL